MEGVANPRRTASLKERRPMETVLEYATTGIALITAGSIGLARSAVYFRSTETGEDRFFSTSLVSVALVALLIGGAFFLGNAVLEMNGSTQILAGLAAIAYTVLVPMVAWRTFGPRAASTGTGALV
jgi:hypothetical protein